MRAVGGCADFPRFVQGLLVELLAELGHLLAGSAVDAAHCLVAGQVIGVGGEKVLVTLAVGLAHAGARCAAVRSAGVTPGWRGVRPVARLRQAGAAPWLPAPETAPVFAVAV